MFSAVFVIWLGEPVLGRADLTESLCPLRPRLVAAFPLRKQRPRVTDVGGPRRRLPAGLDGRSRGNGPRVQAVALSRILSPAAGAARRSRPD